MSSLPAAQAKEGLPHGVPVKRHRFQHEAAVVTLSAAQGKGQLKIAEAAGRRQSRVPSLRPGPGCAACRGGQDQLPLKGGHE